MTTHPPSAFEYLLFSNFKVAKDHLGIEGILAIKWTTLSIFSNTLSHQFGQDGTTEKG
jgi:hypothetical protein